MQIRPIQSTNKNNNNVNFQGIHGSKKILSRLPELRLDRFGIDECGDRFEVLITTGKTTFWGQFKEFFVQAGEGITTNSKGKLELVGAKSAATTSIRARALPPSTALRISLKPPPPSTAAALCTALKSRRKPRWCTPLSPRTA